MKAYQGGQRKNELMKSLLAAASEADINNIALFYALQKPSRAQTPAPGDQAAGKTAAAACNACHGEGGVSASTTPSLAGRMPSTSRTRFAPTKTVRAATKP